MMYMMTEAQHAQIVDALELADREVPAFGMLGSKTEQAIEVAIGMLKAMQPDENATHKMAGGCGGAGHFIPETLGVFTSGVGGHCDNEPDHSELVKRLREAAESLEARYEYDDLLAEAADALEKGATP